MSKRIYFLVISVILIALNGKTQQTLIDKSNCRDGEQVEYCIQHKMQRALLNNPAYLEQLKKDELIRSHETLNKQVQKGIVYKIPVVFHILHDNGSENISDAQVMDALAILNRDFRKLNPDTATIFKDFDGKDNITGLPSSIEPKATDVEIEFVLATKAPNGQCFKGITRTMSPLAYVTSTQNGEGFDQVEAIRNGNDVYQGNWSSDNYLNVFICGNIGGAAGYTYKPSNWNLGDMSNGIWILHTYFGSIGTSTPYSSRAMTHEVGHWLNLSHVWGDNNSPGDVNSCGIGNDFVDDTPDCVGSTSCFTLKNSCSTDNAYWGFDMTDNIENYMEYSYCAKMFTPGQSSRMRQALNSSIGGRNNLFKTSNLIATGTNGNATLCKAEFGASKTNICSGTTIQLEDKTYNKATSWSWSITPSVGWAYTSGSTATDQNPSIRFDSTGLYQVSLTASDGSTSDSEVKSGFIRVLKESASLPFFEGFETYNSLNSTTNWGIENPNNNNGFEISTTVGLNSNKSVVLQNFNQAAGSTDELVSSPVDLSGNVGSLTMSFRYAYRKRQSANSEILRVYVSKDCGETWAQQKAIGGSSLSSVVVGSSWAPQQATDWKTVHITNISPSFWVSNFRYKFKFESNDGNNLYLDNINIYNGSPSDEPILGIAQQEVEQEMNIYPNPADEEIYIDFNTNTAEQLEIKLTDISGKQIQSYRIFSAVGTNEVVINTADCKPGLYFVTLIGSAASSVKSLVIE